MSTRDDRTVEGALRCGAAAVGISPPDDAFPSSFGNPFSGPGGFGGVLHPLRVSAIAVSDGRNASLILSHDLTTPPFLPELADRVGIPEERILMLGTHTHVAPMFPFFGQPPREDAESERMEAYRRLVAARTLSASEQALDRLRPARMGYATGTSRIARNRNQTYEVRQEDGTYETQVGLGVDPDGPTDPTLAVLRFDAEDGVPIAFLANYAVHNIAIGKAGTRFGGLGGMSGDFAALTAQRLEERFPGSVALWTSGAAGDQNPILTGFCFRADPDTGAPVVVPTVDDSTGLAENLAAIHLHDILCVNRSLRTDRMTGPVAGSARTAVLAAEPVLREGGRIVGYGPAAPWKIPMQILRIGDVALLGISGELFSRLGSDLKRASLFERTLLLTHNRIGQGPFAGYILDDDGMERMAHGFRQRTRPGEISERLIETMNALAVDVLP